MEALIILFLLALFLLLAFRFGHDSRPNVRSQEENLANAGFLIDNATITVMADAPTSATRTTAEFTGRAFGLRAGQAVHAAAQRRLGNGRGIRQARAGALGAGDPMQRAGGLCVWKPRE